MSGGTGNGKRWTIPHRNRQGIDLVMPPYGSISSLLKANSILHCARRGIQKRRPEWWKCCMSGGASRGGHTRAIYSIIVTFKLHYCDPINHRGLYNSLQTCPDSGGIGQ